MLGFDFPDALTVITRQINSYVSGASTYGTIFTSNMQKLKAGWDVLKVYDEQAKYWTNIIELQIKQLQDETGTDLFTAGRQVGQAYESALAQYGLKLAALKELLPTQTADLLGFTKAPSIIQGIRDWVVDLIFPGKTGLISSEEVQAARGISWTIPEGVAGALGIAAIALPLYLFLRKKANDTIDYIDNIETEISKTTVVFKNRSKVVLDATNKENPSVITYGPPHDANAPLGSEANPVTAKTIGQITKSTKAKKIVLKPDATELTNIALTEVAKVLNVLPAKLSFELSTKTNPVQQDGAVLTGKYIVLQVSLKTGPTTKHALTTIPLRPLRTGEKAFSTAEEKPVEDEITRQVAELAGSDGTGTYAASIQPAGGAGTASNTPPKLGTGRFGKIGTDVYEVMLNGQYRHITLTEFKALGLNINILPILPPAPTQAAPAGQPAKDPTSLPLLDKLQFYNLSLLYANGLLVLYEGGDAHHSSGVHGILTPDDLLATLKIDKASLKSIGGDSDRLTAQGYNFNTSKANFSTSDFVAYVGQYDSNWRSEHPAPSAPANLGITPNQIKYPYVRFAGSPDIFDRLTGRHIFYKEAVAQKILTSGVIEQISTPRPEVKSATDFATYSGKDLQSFPV